MSLVNESILFCCSGWIILRWRTRRSRRRWRIGDTICFSSLSRWQSSATTSYYLSSPLRISTNTLFLKIILLMERTTRKHAIFIPQNCALYFSFVFFYYLLQTSLCRFRYVKRKELGITDFGFRNMMLVHHVGLLHSARCNKVSANTATVTVLVLCWAFLSSMCWAITPRTPPTLA